jgi:Phage major capsid protein E
VSWAKTDAIPARPQDSGSRAAPLLGRHAADQQFARWVMLHVQSNPLPICTRPRVLIKGKRT